MTMLKAMMIATPSPLRFPRKARVKGKGRVATQKKSASHKTKDSGKRSAGSISICHLNSFCIKNR